MNDWLTVTNMVPPVNDGRTDLRLPKAGNPEGTMGQVTGEPVGVDDRRPNREVLERALDAPGAIVIAACLLQSEN